MLLFPFSFCPERGVSAFGDKSVIRLSAPISARCYVVTMWKQMRQECINFVSSS